MARTPRPQPSSVADFLEAFRRRSKALKHQFGVVECEQVIVREPDGEVRKLELRFADRSIKGRSIRLHFWEDRWVWLDLRKGAPRGWAWEWTFDGRLSGAKTYRDLLDAVERTRLVLPYSEEPLDMISLADIWTPILLQGPKPLTSDLTSR